MTTLSLLNIGKRFSKEWIFRGLTYEFKVGVPVAVVGPNGSGKSTLVKSISGGIPLNEGKINYYEGSKEIFEENWYKKVGISAPYLELIEEFSLSESIDFHIQFRPFLPEIDKNIFIHKLGLEKHQNKYIRDFSS